MSLESFAEETYKNRDDEREKIAARRELWVMLAIVSIFVTVIFVAWLFVKNQLGQTSPYHLSATEIILPKPPIWVGTHFIEEVMERAGLNEHKNIALWDRELPPRVLSAFAAHPWVKEVRRVQVFYPSGARVDLIYRIPVAMIEVTENQLLPVDETGTLLRTDFFRNASQKTLDDYFLISGITSHPVGYAGNLWGDPRVTAAAKLASLLAAEREIWELAKIQLVENVPAENNSENNLAWDLITRGGMKIHWGVWNDETAATKKERLARAVIQYGSLERIPLIHQPFSIAE